MSIVIWTRLPPPSHTSLLHTTDPLEDLTGGSFTEPGKMRSETVPGLGEKITNAPRADSRVELLLTNGLKTEHGCILS
ncbi:hypothetical protein IFM47457_09699 [Aspergillus lentulus]|nr:hypothetical protein IFM47457_09699 [Aspergillus lentulus]